MSNHNLNEIEIADILILEFGSKVIKCTETAEQSNFTLEVMVCTQLQLNIQSWCKTLKE